MENIKKPPQESVTPVVQQEKQEELMHDVLILLENLIHREETTVKLIVDSLYDVGTVNIINQKSKLKMKQGKKSIKSGYKKAIITLKKGQSIDLTTGI